jgi:hypothetical protein
MGILPSELLLRVSDKGLGKTEEKLRSWGKLSTTKDLRARKLKSQVFSFKIISFIPMF